MKQFLLGIGCLFFFSGCATLVPQSDVAQGMSGSEVIGVWGKPRTVKSWKNTCCRERGEESWYYYRTSGQPKDLTKMVTLKDGVVENVFVYKNM